MQFQFETEALHGHQLLISIRHVSDGPIGKTTLDFGRQFLHKKPLVLGGGGWISCESQL